MDHIYDIFNDIEPNQHTEELSNSDELLAQKLSAIDYLSQSDYDNAVEVLTDIEIGSNINNQE